MLLRAASFAAALLACAAAHAEAVDVAVVLLVDVSSSINTDDYRLQKHGHADAFRSPALHRAVHNGPLGQIAVTYVEWDAMQAQVVGWRRIRTPQEAIAFADEIEASPRMIGAPTTGLASALDFTPPLFENNGFEAQRRVVDISGDGADNAGGDALASREQALAHGVTAINGIVIPNEVGVVEFYRRNVVGGSGAFLIVAKDYHDFQDAILDKLVREIADLPPASPERLALTSAQ